MVADVLTGTFTVKSGHAQMLKGGVIMDVVNAEQARIAQEAGAVAADAPFQRRAGPESGARRHSVRWRCCAHERSVYDR